MCLWLYGIIQHMVNKQKHAKLYINNCFLETTWLQGLGGRSNLNYDACFDCFQLLQNGRKHLTSWLWIMCTKRLFVVLFVFVFTCSGMQMCDEQLNQVTERLRLKLKPFIYTKIGVTAWLCNGRQVLLWVNIRKWRPDCGTAVVVTLKKLLAQTFAQI